MTVLDVFPDSQRPELVQFKRQDISDKEVGLDHRRRILQGIQGMQTGQECILGAGPSYEQDNLKDGGSAVRQQVQISQKGSPKHKAERSPVRSRRKSRWKLKFHHQALPPEYLKHYKQQEKKRRQSETKKINQVKKGRKVVRRDNTEEMPSLRPLREYEISGADGLKTDDGVTERLKTLDESFSFKDQLPLPRPDMGVRCKLSEELLNPGLKNISQLNIGLDITQNKAFLENLLTNQIEINRVDQNEVKRNLLNSFVQCSKPRASKHEEKHKRQAIPSSGKILNYSDLPYMGEITLDGIKPRRGRKPKKADICHLIYKNYGQVFPGAPTAGPESSDTRRNKKWKSEAGGVPVRSKVLNSSLLAKVKQPFSDRYVESPLPSVSGLINHTEVQNRIINSLLERRLTQEMKQKSENVLPKLCIRDNESEEPLNLCIRDLKSLKIKLSRKHGNYYETKSKEDELEVKTELEEDIKSEIKTEKTDSEEESSCEEDDLAPFNLVTTELRESSDEDSFLSFNDQITLTKVKPQPKPLMPPREEAYTADQLPLVSWSPELPFMHPSPLLYYERMPGDMSLPPPLPFMTTHKGGQERKPLKAVKARLDGGGVRPSVKRIAPKVISNTAQVIAKRKRSAIFIPPVPTESTANPTTEVSICKFKFTGGAKPSLQEKKMLSVDSGGNFRYYSGTGDKSMRGYEYFPRESLQQCQENTGCSPAGVFLTASALGSGEKIPEDIGHSGFFDTDFPLHLNELTKVSPKGKSDERLPTLRDHLSGVKSEPEETIVHPEDDRNSSENSAEGLDLHSMVSEQEEGSSKRKRCRKSRKSLARERLEQTFKEKGFLIQTQQLESAEGATYCKFRQLRKFTRYLFRSWKDYLPGNVRDLSVDAGVERDELPPLGVVPGLPPLLDLPVKVEENPMC